MFFRKFALVLAALCVVAVGLALAPSSALAQTQAGVVVDAKGVLEVKTFVDPGGTLTRQRAAAARAALDAKVPTTANCAKCRSTAWNRPSATTRAT